MHDISQLKKGIINFSLNLILNDGEIEKLVFSTS